MTETSAPFVCILCGFGVEIDDARIPASHGRCICLRCFEREVGAVKPVPKPIQRDINHVEPA